MFTLGEYNKKIGNRGTKRGKKVVCPYSHEQVLLKIGVFIFILVSQ
jgi:hypothetical protein